MTSGKPLREQVVDAYRARYNADPAYLVRAPGRVNLIGDHTDYNDGFVFPMTIDYAVWVACSPRDDSRVQLRSLNVDTPITFDLADFKQAKSSPTEYVKGMAWAMGKRGLTLRGMRGVLAGDVPMGAGLSSSAALEMAVGRAFAAVADLPWDAKAMALAGQDAENNWVGVNSGIMDQLISAAGVAGGAVLIDCRTLDLTPTPLPSGTQVVVLDTATRRGLVGSKYNERRQQCEAAAQHFGVEKLRDVSVEDFERRADELDATTRKRARHVITENDRTLRAQQAMAAGDAAAVGRLMDASHVSMRDDFENSTPQIDAMVAAAQAHDACYGARMTGGGFGGSAVALVDAGAVGDFVADVTAAYQSATGLDATLIPVTPVDGAAVV